MKTTEALEKADFCGVGYLGLSICSTTECWLLDFVGHPCLERRNFPVRLCVHVHQVL